MLSVTDLSVRSSRSWAAALLIAAPITLLAACNGGRGNPVAPSSGDASSHASTAAPTHAGEGAHGLRALVQTDQPDYSPGSVVTISGDNSNNIGYVEGHTVNVAVSGPNGWTSSCTATVLAGGTWSCQVTLSADPAIATGSYSYTATSTDADGNPITESGTFTDANPNQTYGNETLTSPTAANPVTKDYSDILTISGTVTCTDGDVHLCSSINVPFELQLRSGSGDFTDWVTVRDTTEAVNYTNGVPTPWSFTWQVGKYNSGANSVPPGTYDVRVRLRPDGSGALVILIPQGYDDALVIDKEDTDTTYNGATTGGTSSPLSVSALVTDEDLGVGSGNGRFLPDNNLVGTNVVDFTLYSDIALSTPVGGATTDANIDNTGATTGSPTITLPATPGTYYMKTTYAGNTYYYGSFDGPDTITVTGTILVCKAAPAVAAEYMKANGVKQNSKTWNEVITDVAGQTGVNGQFFAKNACSPGYADAVKAYIKNKYNIG